MILDPVDVTDFEKEIYNEYLKISRTRLNKPYKKRHNFENFENEESYTYIKRLGLFFQRYKHIKIQDFFNAPYYVYPEYSQPFDLKFYISQKSVTVYTLYEKKLLSLDPDNELIFNKTTQGIKFILNFCKETKIPLKKYFAHETGLVNTFWLHLKENKINVYCLFLCEHLFSIYNKTDKEVITLMLGDLMEKIDLYRSVFYNAKKTKMLISEMKHHF